MNDVFILQFHKFKFQVINCLLATNFRDRPYVDINLKKKYKRLSARICSDVYSGIQHFLPRKTAGPGPGL